MSDEVRLCARSACKHPIPSTHYAIWNEPSTGQPRLYCVRCGMRIIDGNKTDTLQLRYEIRHGPDRS